MKIIRIAISAGDPAGIGPEVAAKSLLTLGRIRDAVFFVVGDAGVLARHGLTPRTGVCVVDMGLLGAHDVRAGRPDRRSARASIAYLERAVALVKAGICDGLVTAPISKEQVRAQGFSWPGHTEYLARQFRCK